MSILEQLAEKAIREAIEKGDLDNLPGAGKPIDLSEDSSTPVALRVMYKVFKNASIVPPEVELMKEVADLRDKIKALAKTDPHHPDLPALRKDVVLKEARMMCKIEGFRKMYGG